MKTVQGMYNNNYRLIQFNSYSVEEKGLHDHSVISERHLQALWLEQKYLRNLKTMTGDDVEVISPGIWNTEAGPDFLKAHLRIGLKEFKGDIEIDFSVDGWYAHGHSRDERYDQVVLHISYFVPAHSREIINTHGCQVMSLHLENQMTVPLARLAKLIDLELYPYKQFVGSGRCSKRLFSKLPPNKILDLFKSASYYRLERKIEFLQSFISDPKSLCSAGVAMALGYKHNAQAFLELYQYLIPFRDLSSLELLSLALGITGFFEDTKEKKWIESTYYQELKWLWTPFKSEVLHQVNLRLDHIRPLNHPIRRLVYLTKLLQDPSFESLGQKLMACWRSLNVEQSILSQLQNHIPDFSDDYWNHHYFFELTPRKERLGLMGNSLRNEIIFNVFLPLIFHDVKESGCSESLMRFNEFYQSLQSNDSGKARYLSHRFFGQSEKPDFFKHAQLLQGAYQLHKDFCIHYEASCEGCPFVDRYHQNENN